jgi:hypothetical protein
MALIDGRPDLLQKLIQEKLAEGSEAVTLLMVLASLPHLVEVIYSVKCSHLNLNIRLVPEGKNYQWVIKEVQRMTNEALEEVRGQMYSPHVCTAIAQEVIARIHLNPQCLELLKTPRGEEE